jgi:hypothetical protein
LSQLELLLYLDTCQETVTCESMVGGQASKSKNTKDSGDGSEQHGGEGKSEVFESFEVGSIIIRWPRVRALLLLINARSKEISVNY